MANIILTNHAHMYIKVPYFTSFRFPASWIVGLGLGLVVGLGTVLVLFLLHFSPFRCMLKDQKLQPLQVHPPWHSGYGVRTLLIESQLRGSNPVRAIIFLRFLKVLYSSFLLRLVLALRLLLGLR